jgi:hypothetical protein
MTNIVVVFGAKLDAAQAEMTRSVVELADAGKGVLASELIEKMKKLGYNEGLAVAARELGKLGRDSLASEAINALE